ncbi:VVA0879 family protein [Paraferrimonas sedimenticola]|uniref:Uncharacterized protein n=1 Tax=Paraferrimonas sedimenticola TaxID=375674 RepID=A0AA37RWG2_9GAMM|nr:VVA0879 family protein [Paraferrimonas sedimenticola]GLP96194.1 hypothetical protein GCM10007895_15000 [Paraferrimonas sedimenticola]
MSDQAPKQYTLDDWHCSMRALGYQRMQDVQFECPKCKTRQSANDFIEHKIGSSIQDVQSILSFTCIGRFTANMGCDFSLGESDGGHEVEVLLPSGDVQPCFKPVAPDA